jgi:hypothetical protein
VYIPREKEASFSFFLLSSTRLRAQLQAFITLGPSPFRIFSTHLSSSRAKKKKKVSTFIARALFSPRRKIRGSRATSDSKFKRDSKFKPEEEN